MRNDMNFFAPYEGRKKEQKNKNVYVDSNYSLDKYLSNL